MNTTKFEKTGIHVKTDVFAAVAVVDAKAPYCCTRGTLGGTQYRNTLRKIGKYRNTVSKIDEIPTRHL